MSEKHLTESPWKLLASKYKLKDQGLQSALRDYAEMDSEQDPGAAAEVLTDIAELCIKVRKTNAALKEIGAYLEEICKEAARQKQRLATVGRTAHQQDQPG